MFKPSQKFKPLIFGLYLSLTLAIGWAPMAAKAGAKAGGTLVVGLTVGVSVLDPHVACGWMSKYVNYHIFEGLVEIDLTRTEAPTQFKGQLAESWDLSEDGTIYTFRLRKGVKFHDGTQFDAQAVKYNFDRFLNSEAPQYSETANGYFSFAGFSSEVKSVDVIDDYTVRVTLHQPNFEWLRIGMEDCPHLSIISPAAIEKYGDEGLPLHLIGTGPFKFVEREPGIKIVLDRNDDYWGEKPGLDRIIFRELEDSATRVNALRAGEANLIMEPPWDEIESLKSEGFVITQNNNAPTFFYMTLNMNSPKLQDVRVRKAINYAIDRQGIVDRVLRGYGRPAYGMLNAGTYAHDPDFAAYEYDPEKAKALLAEAGLEPGELVLNFDVMRYGYDELVEKWVQRDLKKVGIEMRLNKMEWLAYLDKWNAGMPDDVDTNEMIWGQQTPYWTSMSLQCRRQPPNGFNTGWYCNPEADKLFDQALLTRDRQKAAELFQKANAMIMLNDAPAVPLYHYFNPMANHPSVKGFVNAPANWWDLSTIWIEQ